MHFENASKCMIWLKIFDFQGTFFMLFHTSKVSLVPQYKAFQGFIIFI
jgi:hypothetical protein